LIGKYAFKAAQQHHLLSTHGAIAPKIAHNLGFWSEQNQCGQMAQKVHAPLMSLNSKEQLFSTTHPSLGAFDGQDRRRRNENGEGQRSQVR
jgi:hypothetical protein